MEHIITSDPEIMSGTPCFAGTRVPSGALFENLATGCSLDEILENYPTLTREMAVEALRRANLFFDGLAYGRRGFSQAEMAAAFAEAGHVDADHQSHLAQVLAAGERVAQRDAEILAAFAELEAKDRNTGEGGEPLTLAADDESEEEEFSLDEIRAEYGLNKKVIIVADPGPLIVLAAADELAVLLRAEMPVEIPDVVYFEATRVPAASRLVDWINENSEMVRIVPTETGLDYQHRLEERRPTVGMDEPASLETLRTFFEIHPLRQARFLFEKPGRRARLDDRASLITIADLRAMVASTGAEGV